MGTWEAGFFGPAAVRDVTVMTQTTMVPSGVAGQFEVNSVYTNIVGAFAAEH